MYSKHRLPFSWMLPVAVVLGGGLVLLASFLGVDGADLTSPLTALGAGLRTLSLGSTGGNIAAWAIVLVLTCLPALGLLCRNRCWTDLLLALAAGEIFAGLYFQINPFLLNALVSLKQLWALTWAAAVLATLVAWAVLRLLRYMSQDGQKGHTLSKIMVAAAILLVFLSAALLTANHIAELEAVAAANTNSNLEDTATYLILRILFALDVVISVVFGELLLEGSLLVRTLDEAPFSEQTIAIADHVSRRCRRFTAVSLLIYAAGNVIQMLFFSHTRSISVEVNLPIGLILLSLCLTLLCRYFRQAKAVNDDNATII